MMNKFNTAFVVVLALLVASCQLPLAGTGSLKIQVPSGNSGRLAADGHGATARLQLVRNNAVVPLAGKQFVEASRSGQTITIDGVPSGSGYVLYFSAGDQIGNFFVVSDFVASSPFEISAGTDTAVAVTASPSPVTVLASGAGPHKSLAVGSGASQLYFTKAGGLYTAASVAETENEQVAPLPGAILRSLGSTYAAGDLTVALNTDSGLGGYSDGSITFNMLNSDGAELTPVPDVTRSAVLHYGTKTVHLYSGKGLTAGMAVTDDVGDAPHWTDIEALLDLPETITDSLKDQDGLVTDFAAAPNFAYISTVLGVFRIDSDIINGDSKHLADQFVKGSDAIKVAVKLGDRSLAIGPVGAFGTGTLNEGSGLVFAGTAKGVFSASTDGGGRPLPNFNSLTLVDGTFGLNIAALSTIGFGGEAYTAAWAKNTGEVIVFSGQGTNLKKVPALAGLPTGVLTLTWWRADSDGENVLKLVISGDNGTVIYTVPDVSESLG